MEVFFVTILKNSCYYKSRHITKIMTTEWLQAKNGSLTEKYTQFHLTGGFNNMNKNAGRRILRNSYKEKKQPCVYLIFG